MPRTSSDCKNHLACRLTAVMSELPSRRNCRRLRTRPSCSEKVIPKSRLSSIQKPKVPYRSAMSRLPRRSTNPSRIFRDSLRTEKRLRKMRSKANVAACGNAVYQVRRWRTWATTPPQQRKQLPTRQHGGVETGGEIDTPG